MEKINQNITFLHENDLPIQLEDEKDINIDQIYDKSNVISMTTKTTQIKQPLEKDSNAQKNQSLKLTQSLRSNNAKVFLKINRKATSQIKIPPPPKNDEIYTTTKKPVVGSTYLNDFNGLKIYQYP